MLSGSGASAQCKLYFFPNWGFHLQKTDRKSLKQNLSVTSELSKFSEVKEVPSKLCKFPEEKKVH